MVSPGKWSEPSALWEGVLGPPGGGLWGTPRGRLEPDRGVGPRLHRLLAGLAVAICELGCRCLPRLWGAARTVVKAGSQTPW